MDSKDSELQIASKDNLAKAEQYLATVDPVMADLIERFGPCKLEPHKDYYGALLRAIVSQQLSVKAASTIFARFLALFGEGLPTPEQILDRDHEELRAAGLSNAKVNYVKDLSQKISSNELEIDKISHLDDQLIIDELIKVKGIGLWSSHMFLIFCMGRLNVLPYGDLGIRRGASILYGLSELPEQEALMELSKTNKWSPYNSVASWYIWQSLNNK
ncbi:MAG TPA: DNA-3-methyladenine glycosylase [Candidatus Saccharimonadales bacterium]